MAQPINTTVTIRGASYQLRTDLSEDALQAMASYVDTKMREVDPTGTLPPVKVSVLASLTIAGELIDERRRTVGVRSDLGERLQRLETLLDEAIGSD